MSLDNIPNNTPSTSVPNPPWIDFVMDIWLILGVISLLLALWFIPSNWRSTGLLMLGYGLMFITSSVMLRRHLPNARATTIKSCSCSCSCSCFYIAQHCSQDCASH